MLRPIIGDEMNNNDFWEHINEVTEDDILTIVMDLANGRASSGETMDRIHKRCEAVYKELKS